ncbi:hypothetical protein ACX93W_04380 [Paenibacillus sp. CAU 1782]
MIRNLRLLAGPFWLAAFVIVLTLAVFSNPSFMATADAAFWGERFVTLLTLLLFPPLALMESGGIGEGLLAKRHRFEIVFVCRWLLSAGYMAILVAVFYGVTGVMGANFGGMLIVGVLINSLALGSVALLAAILFGSLSGGYILAVAWYLLDWMTKGKWTGQFYLFSMSDGFWNADKLWLLALSLLCLIGSAWILPILMKGTAA